MITWIDTGRLVAKTDVSITMAKDRKYVQFKFTAGSLARMGHPERISIGFESTERGVKIYFLPGSGYKVVCPRTASGVIKILTSKLETYIAPPKIVNDYVLNKTADGKYFYVESNPGPVWINK